MRSKGFACIKIKPLTPKSGNVHKLFIYKKSQRFSSIINMGQVSIMLIPNYSLYSSSPASSSKASLQSCITSSPPGNLEFLEDKQWNAAWAQQGLLPIYHTIGKTGWWFPIYPSDSTTETNFYKIRSGRNLWCISQKYAHGRIYVWASLRGLPVVRTRYCSSSQS